MILAWLLLLTGLTISAVAIYYSVIGLAAVFAAATIPIYIMGASLEVAKLVCASWLKANWDRAPGFMKAYMMSAVIMLMIITSMGIFGFLSKAHSDQGIVSGDVIERVSILDEKIKTEKENIDVARKTLKQLDESVDQVMARSNDERGADKASQMRRAQQRERTQLQRDITTSQNNIRTLNEERAPIAKDLRKVEAEVGPIKYIAALVYGDNPDTNVLEKAVTWVIIMIVVVFDPLAVIMLLAAQMTFGWRKEQQPTYEADDGPLTEKQIEQVTESVKEPLVEEEKSILERHPYLTKPFDHFKNIAPIVHKPEPVLETSTPEQVDITTTISVDSTEQQVSESTYQILPELEEESKKKTFMIKENGQQIVKSK
jgi:hypothetical protein